MVEFPKSFILMPPKTGSTSMYYILSEHPEISTPTPKELGFFSTTRWKDVKGNEKKLRETYRKKWDINASGLPIDITPAYCSVRSINRIFQIAQTSKIKFIYFTRNPYERALSHMRFRRAKQEIIHNKELNEKFRNDIDEDFTKQWLQSLESNRGMERFKFQMPNQKNKRSWDKCVWNNYIKNGLYSEQIKLLWEKTGKENVLILTHEDLVKDHQSVLDKMFDFLDLTPKKINNLHTNESNFWKKYYDASSELTEEHKAFLKGCFIASNKELLSLTGIDYL
tara:strand:- start:815 stop:1657 length:843 start_codon:yes stop_codon:yes gene_type:complete